VISAHDEPLHFYGPPRRLAALLREPLHEGPFEASIVGTGEAKLTEGDLRARVKPVAGANVTEIVLVLPRTTAPGKYEARIDLGGGRGRTAIIEVQPWELSRVFPPSMFLNTKPGGHTSISLTLTNIGNTSIEIPRAAAFVLAQSEALCNAIVATVGAGLHDGHEIIDRLAEELKAGFGGVAKIRVKTSERRIGPGQTQDIEAELRMPDRIEPGRQYWGLWSIYPRKAYMMRIQVDAP
jgi:hypothetical protein